MHFMKKAPQKSYGGLFDVASFGWIPLDLQIPVAKQQVAAEPKQGGIS